MTVRWVDIRDGEAWRGAARAALAAEVPPEAIRFRDADESRPLLTTEPDGGVAAPAPATPHLVPRPFLDLCRMVAAHGDPSRWDRLYRVLWRITHGEPHVLELAGEEDVAALRSMERSVRRDCHKTKAFVRFRRVVDEAGERFVAWHRPDHDVLPLVAGFFARRFPAMAWSILTPTRSAHHEADAEAVTFGPGVPESQAPPEDDLEAWWKAYYAAIFNPARLKVRAMKAELPVRHWRTLPEAELIPDLVRTARQKVDQMVRHQEGSADSARPFVPDGATEVATLAEAAKACRGCPLYQDATQVVFGEGGQTARIVLVGEQPGDLEDRAGRPFVGPAGQVLDRILASVGLDRSTCYVTNVVKHFKFRMTGRRRLHQTPTAREMWACQPWLEEELRLIKPEVLVCLGATAAKALIGKEFRITQQRGEVLPTDWCAKTIATYHPSAILRAPEPAQQAALEDLVRQDLTTALGLLDGAT